MSDNRPLILITNDDGIDAPGLHRLVDWLSPLGRVVAVAPTGPCSGQSSAITVSRPLHISRRADYAGAGMWAVDGTPVDCVKLAMHTVLAKHRPDFIFSGINHGANSGNSIIYSGTMGAVLEGCMLGIPSVGFSYLSHSWEADLAECRGVVESVATDIVSRGLPDHTCLNVNIPRDVPLKGMKVCRAARGFWTEEYTDYTDPSGRPFYWLTGHFNNNEPDNPATDIYWLDRGYASIVACHPDQSAPAGTWTMQES